ncbi:MAG: SDR family NAD(P)-dependent oxidoreductase [Proteobacteria bacterium]|nr:SDR family NAD(P)-dependent oxidoreductase [Pseudomonadota bacterium]
MSATLPDLVWITGASSGIGRALALRLARDGHRVAASARNVEALAQLVREGSGRVVPVPLDVTDKEAVRAAVTRIEAALGPIGLAVLNAGAHRPLSADDFSTDAFRALVEVNLMGVVHSLDAVLAVMRPRRAGHIAVVASVAGYRGLPTAAAYGATKAALINMCEALRLDCARLGIKLQMVNPGFVETPLTERNSFPMPFLIPVERAVDRFITGLASDRFEITFSRRFAAILRLLRCLPYPLYFRLVRAATGK